MDDPPSSEHGLWTGHGPSCGPLGDIRWTTAALSVFGTARKPGLGIATTSIRAAKTARPAASGQLDQTAWSDGISPE